MAITLTAKEPLVQIDKPTSGDHVAFGSGLGTITVAGTYTGSPTSISAGVYRVSNDAVVIAPAVIVPSPAAGVYSATIGNIPESHTSNSLAQYYVAVTAAGTGDTVSGKVSWPFRVGRWCLDIGQSNGDGQYTVSSSPPSASAGTYYYNGTTYATVPAANGIRHFLNDMVAHTGVPWGALENCVAGVDRSYFDSGATGYVAAMAQIASGPGDIECWRLMHGEAAAVDSGSASNRDPVQYADGWAATHTAMAAALGRTLAQLPGLAGSLSRYTGGSYTAASWYRAQCCVRYTGDKLANVHYGTSNLDSGLTDDIHRNAVGHGNTGQRDALDFARLWGLVAASSAWEMTAAARVNNTTTTATMSQSLGGDFAGSDITGFEVSSDGIVWVAAIGQRTNSTTITLTHDSLRFTNRLCRYGYGATPDMTSPPLETYLNAPPLPSMAWAVSGGGDNPVWQFVLATRPAGTTTVPAVTGAFVPGGNTLYGLFTVPSSRTVSAHTVNSNAITSIDQLTSPNTATLFSYDMAGGHEASWTLTLSSNPFNTGTLLLMELYAGTPTFIDLYTAVTASGASVGVDASVQDGGMVLATAMNATAFTPDDALDGVGIASTNGYSAYGLGTVTNAANTMTFTRTGNAAMSVAAATFAAPDELPPDPEPEDPADDLARYSILRHSLPRHSLDRSTLSRAG